MDPIVIIGTGLAGYSTAREFRKLDRQTPLVMVTRDDGAFYSKPMLSSALTQGKDPAALITSPAEKMAETLAAEILPHTSVTGIDPAKRTLELDGVTRRFGKLVIASGATPIRLPIPGEGAEDILSVNNLWDYARFRQALNGAQRIAIIGPGLIGCEFANDLLHADKQVTLIGPDPWPISGIIPEPAGRALQQALADDGITWHLGTTSAAVERSTSGYQIPLDNGATVTADLVLSAVGLRPDLTLAQLAGLESDRGIVTDRTLQTSAPDIYAIGDCAEVNGRHLPYVAPLMAGAKALARTLTGEPSEVHYPTMPVAIKTSRHPVVCCTPPGPEGEWCFEGGNGKNGNGVKGRFMDAVGRMTGFVLTGAFAAEKQVLLKALAPDR